LIGGSRKAYPLRSARSKFIARGQQATLKLKLPTKALFAIRRALRRHRTVSVKLTIKARDAVGNTTADRRTIKLKTSASQRSNSTTEHSPPLRANSVRRMATGASALRD
jgi:hypothetical protein